MKDAALMDRAPVPLNYKERQTLSKRIGGLALLFGQRRPNGDGWTVEFQPDGLSVITCNLIERGGAEFLTGAYVDHAQILHQYPSGYYIDKLRRYGLPDLMRPFVSDLFALRDPDNNIVAQPDQEWMDLYNAIMNPDMVSQDHSNELVKLLGPLQETDVVPADEAA